MWLIIDFSQLNWSLLSCCSHSTTKTKLQTGKFPGPYAAVQPEEYQQKFKDKLLTDLCFVFFYCPIHEKPFPFSLSPIIHQAKCSVLNRKADVPEVSGKGSVL